MTKKAKVFYILSIIFLAIAVIGGGMGVTGFFMKTPNSPVIQLIGVITLVCGYGISALFDFLSRRFSKKK